MFSFPRRAREHLLSAAPGAASGRLDKGDSVQNDHLKSNRKSGA